MIPVRNIMLEHLVAVASGATVRAAADLMCQHKMGSVLVRRGEEYIGIITETDMVRKVVGTGHDPSTMTVDEAMSGPLITIDENQSVLEASNVMDRHRIRHLPVASKGRIVGLVSVRDLLHHIYGWGPVR